MKHFFACETGKLCSFLLLLLGSFSIASAQDYEQQRQKKLNGLDLSGLGKTLFLNAGITSPNEVNYFKALAQSIIPKNEPVSSEEWTNLYERLMDIDLRPKNERIPDLNQLVEADPAKLTKSNIVPIGIMDLESIYLTGKQVADNEATKKAGNAVDFSAYERIRIVYAAALQEDIYQADVSFRISPELYIANHEDIIQDVEVDFNDGKGFKSYTVSEQLIPYRFESIGEHSIRIRLKTDSAIYLFETKVNVRQLERIKPYKEFQIAANRISKDTLNMDQSARTMLVGGEIRIILGCDQILDKVIIVAEGFDIGQDVTLDKIEAKYRQALNQYLTEGYDLVLLNYNDGRAAIQDNAQVLKAVIQQINTIKQGTTQSIVIGESMSGLVARWALREMENNGQAHQVRLMLCYDTPHQGVNVPVGMTQLLYDASPTVLSTVILKFFAKGWRNLYSAMATPAAKQMMLHQAGHPNVGGKHQDFDTFHTQLLALGNGGYPQNCRNIAVTHGSMNASDRDQFDNHNYGSRILRSWTPFLLQNTNIDIHTNQLNQNASVFRFGAWGILFKVIGINRTYNSPFNDDFLPGGRSVYNVPSKLIDAPSEFEFCFVPTFSAIDYQGPRNTQAERELLNVVVVNAATSNRQTPFAAIYGRNDQINSPHVDADFVDFDQIGIAEGLLTNIPACPSLPIPPTPTISTYNTCYPFSEKRTTEDNTANITVSLAVPSNGQYIHNWTVLPTQQTFTTTGDQITFQAEDPGSYQVICVRTYPNRRDLESSHTVTFLVSDCGNVSVVPENPNPNLVVDSDIDITDIWEGDFLLTTPLPDSSAVFAHYQGTLPVILYATTQNGVFISRATLETSGMFPEYAALFAEIDPGPTLPVVLREFNVRAAEVPATAPTVGALLTWSTTYEFNSDHFEIEKSNTGKDWQKIGSVNAENLSTETADYFFVDSSTGSNLTYYRLKMVDADGTFAYSRIQSIHFDRSSDIAIFPNPVEADSKLQLLLGDSKVSKISIYNLAGKQVLESDKPISQANIQSLPAGKYIVRIRLTDGSESSCAIVKR